MISITAVRYSLMLHAFSVFVDNIEHTHNVILRVVMSTNLTEIILLVYQSKQCKSDNEYESGD